MCIRDSLHVEQQRFGGVLHVEGVETAVLRDDGHIRFVGKIPYGSLHTDDVPVSYTHLRTDYEHDLSNADSQVQRTYHGIGRYL